MKKVLYIDPFSSDGHIGFNKIYIKKIIESDVCLELILRDGYISKLGFSSDLIKLGIPDSFYLKSSLGIINRVYFIKVLLFIKNNIDFSSYDSVFLAGYEEISLYFSGIKHKLILINHNNIDGLNKPIKRFFFKLISKNNYHIVFNESIRKYLLELGVVDVFVVPHGLPKPISLDLAKVGSDLETNKCFVKINSTQFKFIIFSPSHSSNDNVFMEKLIEDKRFLSFLKDNKILFVLKGNYRNTFENNILIINEYLSQNQYNVLFLLSDFILLPYPKSFNKRVSAVLFECMVNNKSCLLSDIEAFRNYELYFNNNPFFKDIDELINIIKETIEKENKTNNFNNLGDLTPNFNVFFEEFKKKINDKKS